MVINVFLNVILIPKYGIVGSALATLISYSWIIFHLSIFSKTRTQFIMILKSILFIDFVKLLKGKFKIEY